MEDYRRILEQDGYCVVPDILSSAVVAEAHERSLALADTQTAEERRAHYSLGSLIRLWREPYFAELVANERMAFVLRSMGFVDVRYSNGFLFAKSPGAPATFWHHDWWMWGDASSYSSAIPQIGLMYYLCDTTPENGCLRVLPGSHRRRHQLHDVLIESDNNALRRIDDPAAPPHQDQPDQRAVPVAAGSAVILDARLLHGAYPNHSAEVRPLLTFWHFPDYQQLSEAARARIGDSALPEDWPAQRRAQLAPWLHTYTGSAEPEPIRDHPDQRLSAA